VEKSAAEIWKPAWEKVMAYLTGPVRGLSPETIRRAGLGVTFPVAIPTKSGKEITARGIVIPWFDASGRLGLIKIRQPPKYKPKYVEAYRDSAALCGIFPNAGIIRPGWPLIVTEGEFDALLLGQYLSGLAAVATLGSASARPAPAILGRMLAAAPWFVATDADEAGQKSAARWPDDSAKPQIWRLTPPASIQVDNPVSDCS
jgi:DNA primase